MIPNSDEQYEGKTEADKGIERTHYIGWPWNISMMKENLFRVRKFISGRGNSKCKGPGRQKCMACLRNRMEVRVVRMLWAKFSGKNRMMWNQIYKDQILQDCVGHGNDFLNFISCVITSQPSEGRGWENHKILFIFLKDQPSCCVEKYVGSKMYIRA